MQIPLKFRPICPADEAFLYRVFVSTRPDVAAADLGEQEKQQFLKMQFDAQHSHYQTYFPDADFQVILSDKTPIGRLYIRRPPDQIHIIDIALLPEHRSQGIGTRLMADILAEGQRTQKPVRIHVEHFNRALSFYKRLGFVQIDDIGTHFLMERSPSEVS